MTNLDKSAKRIGRNITNLLIENEKSQQELGHADSKVTKDIYMHVTDKIKKADNERLASVKIL